MTTPELDKKAREEATKFVETVVHGDPKTFTMQALQAMSRADFRHGYKAGYTSRDKEVEHLQAENARISEEHNKLADKYLKLSADYADLYERRKTIEQVQTPAEWKKL